MVDVKWEGRFDCKVEESVEVAVDAADQACDGG